eukprot:1352616-Pleurochrysis_carterae.AAC.2
MALRRASRLPARPEYGCRASRSRPDRTQTPTRSLLCHPISVVLRPPLFEQTNAFRHEHQLTPPPQMLTTPTAVHHRLTHLKPTPPLTILASMTQTLLAQTLRTFSDTSNAAWALTLFATERPPYSSPCAIPV